MRSGTHADLHGARTAVADQVHHRLVGQVLGGHDHALDPVGDHEVAQVEVAESTEVGQALRRIADRRSTETAPTGSSPYSGCVLSFRARASGDLGLADEQDAGRAAEPRARRAGPRARRAHASTIPETPKASASATSRPWPCEQLQVDPEQQGPEHERVKERRQVVERRGVDPLHVALVEAVEAEEEQPDGQRRQEPEQAQDARCVWDDEQRDGAGAEHRRAGRRPRGPGAGSSRAAGAWCRRPARGPRPGRGAVGRRSATSLGVASTAREGPPALLTRAAEERPASRRARAPRCRAARSPRPRSCGPRRAPDRACSWPATPARIEAVKSSSSTASGSLPSSFGETMSPVR